MHREPLRDSAYWQEWIKECIEDVKERQDKLKVTPFPEKWKKNSITQSLYYDCKRLITLKYSGETPVEEIANDYPQLIDAWVAYNQNISTGDNKKHLLLTHDYYRVLTLISWGIIFNAPSELFQKMADHMHSNGEDALIETLLAMKLKDRTTTDKLIYPKSFELLYKTTQTKGTEQAALIKEYLGNWYKNMKDFINYDAHKAKGEGDFEGYWSFEVAAVVALYNIDDSSFRDMDFYPKDIAAFAKTNI
ncbi:PoNe immunity protein domain-containing protein [Pedobacter nutrimenti]|uniref:PoNe immunity protein domain-containing protein n=1 Tax=Pedobacter nutrimenti TaxID=1241337 RepID=UPI00293156B9|nr:PoNe immunity protein domain-containing protein [Pedobacter nutrimenti]